MRRPRLPEVWNPLLGMLIFLVFAVSGYLKHDWLAFWGHVWGFFWFLLDVFVRVAETENLKKALRTIRYGFIVCFAAFAGYVVFRRLGSKYLTQSSVK